MLTGQLGSASIIPDDQATSGQASELPVLVPIDADETILPDTSLAAQVFARDDFRCRYCDFDASTFLGWAFLSIDHFLAKSAGGTHDPSNLLTACCVCNQMKAARRYDRLED